MAESRTFGIVIEPNGSISVLEKLDKGFKRVDSSSAKASKSIDKYSKSSKVAAKAKKELNSQVGTLVTRYASLGAAVAATTAFVAGSLRSFNAFQQSIAEIDTLLGNNDNINEYSSSVRELSKQFGVNNVEQASALYSVISAGAGTAAEATEILTAANKLAIGGVTDVAIAADGLTTVLNAYSLESSQAGMVSDILFATMKGGKTKIGELASSLGKVAPLASSLGVGLGELNAAIAVTTKSGVKTSEAVTQLKAAFSNILKPSGEAAELAAKLANENKNLGFQFSVAGLKADGLAGFLKKVEIATGGSEEQLSKLFGSTDAVQVIMPLAGAKADDFASSLDSIRNSAGETDKAFGKFTETMGFKYDTTIQQVAALAVSLGESLAPAIISVLEATGFLLSNLTQVSAAFAALAIIKFVPPLFAAMSARLIALNASLVTTQLVTTQAGAAVGLMGVGMTRATTQVIAMTTAQKLQAIATRGLTASVGLLRGGMALLGGPAGVIALVVSALIIFSNKSRQAKDDTDQLIASINEMSKGADLGGNLVKINEEIARLERGVKGATISVRNLTDQWGANAGATKKEQKRLDGLVSSLANAKKASGSLTKQIEEQEKITTQLSSATSSLNDNVVTLTGSTLTLAQKKQALATIMTASTNAANQLAKATGIDLLRSQTELNKAVAQAEIKHANYNKALQAAHNTVINKAAPGTAEYTRLMQALGFTVAKTETVTVKATTAMGKAWQKFGRDADSSLQQFFRSGLKDTKSFTGSIKDSFKDMIADILTKITKLIASNAFKKLVDFLSGKSQTTKFSSGLKDLFSGGPSSSTPSGGPSSASPTSLVNVGVKIAKGAKTAWSAVTKAGSLLKTGATKLLGAIPGWGQAALAAIAVFAIAKKVFGGGRSPQELAEDQLSAVDIATKEGRNEQVALGQAAGTSVSFLGGFDEFSTFFGIDKAKDDIQKIGDIFKANFGGDALLAVKDGILRIEDKSRKFSENNDEIVAQVKASIIEFELQFTKTEKSILASLGKSITGVDDLFDSMKDSGLSASEKLSRSYSQFFNKTKAEGDQWVADSGVQADRWAQIFNNASGPVLSQLVGLGDAGVQSFNDIANSAQGLSSDMIGLNDVLLETARRQSNIVPFDARGSGSQATSGSAAQQTQQDREAQAALIAKMNELVEQNRQVAPLIDLAIASAGK